MPQSGIEPTSPAYKTGPHPLKVSRAKFTNSLNSLAINCSYCQQILNKKFIQATTIDKHLKSLSLIGFKPHREFKKLVCVEGFEPPTPWFQAKNSNQTELHTEKSLVAGGGFEPPISRL